MTPYVMIYSHVESELASFTLQKGVFYIAKGHLLRACLQPIDFLLVTKLILKHFR